MSSQMSLVKFLFHSTLLTKKLEENLRPSLKHILYHTSKWLMLSHSGCLLLLIGCFGVFTVQVGNQIPRHSSPYASASADQNHLTHSLWSSSSLENIILDLARKYCMRADSRIDLADMAHSQAEQSHPSRGDSDWSHCSKSGLHRSSDCRMNLFSVGSSYNLHSMSGGDHCMMESQPDLYRITNSHPSLLRMTDSHPNLYRMTDSQPSLFCMTDSQPSLHCMTDSCRDLSGKMRHCGKRVHSNRHASSYSRCGGVSASALSFAGTSFPGGRLGPSNFNESRKFRSTPDLQVTHYETAFGPENQTVTRVYYSHGVSTDFHHGSSKRDLSAPVETHFDVATGCGDSQNHRTSFERFDVPGNASSGCTETLRAATGRGNLQTGVCRQETDVPSISPHAASHVSQNFFPGKTRTIGPAHRRTRAERHKTFGGSQFDFKEGEEVQRGMNAAARQLSASTPFLPTIGENDSQGPNLVTIRSKLPGWRSDQKSSSGKKTTSLFVRCKLCWFLCNFEGVGVYMCACVYFRRKNFTLFFHSFNFFSAWFNYSAALQQCWLHS